MGMENQGFNLAAHESVNYIKARRPLVGRPDLVGTNKFGRILPLLPWTPCEDDDRAALGSIVTTEKRLDKGECFRAQGAISQGIGVLHEGAVQAIRTLANGRQQILALFVAGDVMDCQPAGGAASTFNLCALTPSRVAEVPFSRLSVLISERPGIAFALWRETARHAAIQAEWLVSLGSQNSLARLAHFICELSLRFKAAGLGDAQSFPLPLTQGEIADALGISVVHVNRVLQHLRRDGLIALSQGVVHLLDREALYKVAEFDPHYLGLETSRELK
jgi:CRP-like cAMP-binding protein